MAVTVKKVTLWRKEVSNRPGELARTLQPLAQTGVSLQVLMGYRYPGAPEQAAIELFPVNGARAESAARQAGFSPSGIPTLIVEGEDKPGLGYTIAQAMGAAGLNMGFAVAQVIGKRYSAVLGFSSSEDAERAAAILKRVSPPRRERVSPGRRPSSRPRRKPPARRR